MILIGRGLDLGTRGNRQKGKGNSGDEGSESGERRSEAETEAEAEDDL